MTATLLRPGWLSSAPVARPSSGVDWRVEKKFSSIRCGLEFSYEATTPTPIAIRSSGALFRMSHR